MSELLPLYLFLCDKDNGGTYSPEDWRRGNIRSLFIEEGVAELVFQHLLKTEGEDGLRMRFLKLFNEDSFYLYFPQTYDIQFTKMLDQIFKKFGDKVKFQVLILLSQQINQRIHGCFIILGLLYNLLQKNKVDQEELDKMFDSYCNVFGFSIPVRNIVKGK